MAANLKPIFPKGAFTNNMPTGITLTSANTAKDGTGTTATIFTAGVDGARIDNIIARSLGTNVPTVLRIFINNGTGVSSTDSTLVHEVSLPATTLSETIAQVEIKQALDKVIPAGYKINVCIGTAVAAGWAVSAEGGDY